MACRSDYQLKMTSHMFPGKPCRFFCEYHGEKRLCYKEVDPTQQSNMAGCKSTTSSVIHSQDNHRAQHGPHSWSMKYTGSCQLWWNHAHGLVFWPKCILRLMLVKMNFLKRHVIGWWQCCQLYDCFSASENPLKYTGRIVWFQTKKNMKYVVYLYILGGTKSKGHIYCNIFFMSTMHWKQSVRKLLATWMVLMRK